MNETGLGQAPGVSGGDKGVAMSIANELPHRIAVVGGGPAGSFSALCALKHSHLAGREISVTIYEGKDFSRPGQPGCNMCAGLIPASVVSQFSTLDLTIPPEMILSHISSYALHTTAGVLNARQLDAQADVISVYRGTGPAYGGRQDRISFDAYLLEQAVARGARLRRSFVEGIRRARPVEIVSAGKIETYDLVVLATGINGHPLSVTGFDYRPPPTATMCQTEIYLGEEEVLGRVGHSVHIFLPPDDVATYGILIPKGPFVTASLLNARNRMRSMAGFLGSEQVTRVLGHQPRRVCGCLPRISVGPARGCFDDGFVAIGDVCATRLYKNGIGSALATARRAALTAIWRGARRADFAASYLPLCRAINNDNMIGRLLFLQVPALKRFRAISMAHYLVATDAHHTARELHARILWGMFTGTYPYHELLRMSVHPTLITRLGLALARSLLQRRASSGIGPLPRA